MVPIYTDPINELFENIDKFTDATNEDASVKRKLSGKILKDFIRRFGIRYHDLRNAELNTNSTYAEERQVELLSVQLSLLDKNEGFHQHVYSTLNAFILFLNHYGNAKTVMGNFPTKSTSKFLKHCELFFDKEGGEYLLALNKSLDFRAKFVDHVQQHVAHDWMTYRHDNETFIIYFKPADENRCSYTTMANSLSPYSENFSPPIDYEYFYIPPHSEETFYSLLNLINTVVSDLLKNIYADKTLV